MFNKYSEGERIICIDNTKTLYLSKNKIYRVLYMCGSYIQIEDDGGYINGFESKRFKSLAEKRDEIISYIL